MIDIKSQIIKPSLNLEDLRVVASAEGWGLTDLRSLHFFLNRNFKYRRKITITEQSGSDLTDYQVLIELNSSNFNFEHAQTNGEDIRFTDANGNLLDYWIEEWDAVNEIAKVWVKVPSIPANSSVEIFMYYGNPSAVSESDGENTFMIYDDFDDSSLGPDWTFVNPDGNQGVSESDSSVTLICDDAEESNLGTSTENQDAPRIIQNISGDFLIDAKVELNLAGPNAQVKGVGILVWQDSQNFFRYMREIVEGSNKVRLFENKNDNTTQFESYCGSKPTYLRVTKIGNEFKFYFSDDYSSWTFLTNRTFSMGSISVGLVVAYSYPASYSCSADWFRARKYTEPEPSVSMGGEESA